MHTPSLGRRLVAAGVGAVTLLAVALDLLLFFTLRSTLMAGVERVLDARATVVRAAAGGGGAVLAARLSRAGLRVEIRDRAGRVVYLARPTRPDAELSGGGPVAFRDVTLPGRLTARVFASSAEPARKLHRLVTLELAVTPLVVTLAFFLLRWIAESALSPIDAIADTARRTAGGRRGQRLRPDRRHTRLGQVAAAYDGMLDTLEAAEAEARQAEQRAERLQDRFRHIIDTATEAFVAIDEAGRVVEWNAQAERTFGWSRDEMIGRGLAETIVPPDLRDAHLDGVRRYLETSVPRYIGRRVELSATSRDGRRFPVEVAIWATGDDEVTFSAFVQDVSQRKHGEEAMARLAAIVESTDEAMVSTTLHGVILTWNQGAERIYGYTADEVVGRHLSLLAPERELPAQQRAHTLRSLERVRRGEPAERVVTSRRCKDGSLIDVALTLSPIRDASGSVRGVASIARDITEEKRVAAQLDSTLVDLERALEQARASEAATRRFLDDAAHQLRAPITNIRACAETLLRDVTPDERDRLLAAVVGETSRASRLMSGLLQMARLNQRPALHLEPCDLVALCQGEADRAQATAPGIEVVLDRDGAAVGQPKLDRHAVREALANVLDNARRHAASRIEVAVGRQDGWVSVRVGDDGPGVGPGQEEAIFERFVSLDHRGGSGLGLPIARELARAHGGELSYEAKAFVLRLPAGDRA